MLEMTVSLKDLKKLRREGFLTEEVFARARAKFSDVVSFYCLDILGERTFNAGYTEKNV